MEPTTRNQRTYGTQALAERLLQSLVEAGCKLDALTTADLIAFDELHIMGRQATIALGRCAGLTSAMRVLDIGCGVGGPARTLAENFGCPVVGVDLAESYVTTATRLTRYVGLAERVIFRVADALSLPFASGDFDAVVMIHLGMNIADKGGLLEEAHRMLKPGGRLAMWEVCRGDGDILFPVPWSADPAYSHLVSIEDFGQLLSESGFQTVVWEDASAEAVHWVTQRMQGTRNGASDRKTPDLDLIMPDFRRKRANISKNLLQGSIRVLRAVAARP